MLWTDDMIDMAAHIHVTGHPHDAVQTYLVKQMRDMYEVKLAAAEGRAEGYQRALQDAKEMYGERNADGPDWQNP